MCLQASRKLLWIDDRNTGVSVYTAQTALERARGLLFRPPLKADEALLIVPCNSVHMFGMGYPIDVVFLDSSTKVNKLVPKLTPWRMAACMGSRSVLELPVNSVERLCIQMGSKVEYR